MTWDFGHNCTFYVPTLRKCRILIDKRRAEPGLVEEKWLGTQDVLVYLNLSHDTLINAVVSGEIKTKQQNGRLTFGVSVASQYDDCYNVETGGQCLYFEAHNGPKICCLVELSDDLRAQHPNLQNLLSRAEIATLEIDIIKVTGSA